MFRPLRLAALRMLCDSGDCRAKMGMVRHAVHKKATVFSFFWGGTYRSNQAENRTGIRLKRDAISLIGAPDQSVHA